jgi:nucleoside-diphosphate-sugar epimerase
MNLLITGTSGFLGGHLLSRCGEGNTLAGLARNAGFAGQVEIFSSAETERIDFEPGAIVMCHAAVSSGSHSQGNHGLYESNVHLTERICKRFPEAFIVYLSTVSVFPPTDGLITEASLCSPASNYAISKLWGEKIVSAHGNSAILRVSSLYGPRMKENTLIPNYIRQAREGGEISVWGDGSRMQNYLHVSDAGGYVLALLERRAVAAGRIFLGTGHGEHSNAEIATLIARHTGAKLKFIHQDSSPSCRYNNQHSKATMGYSPTMGLEEGLKDQISFGIRMARREVDREHLLSGVVTP